MITNGGPAYTAEDVVEAGTYNLYQVRLISYNSRIYAENPKTFPSDHASCYNGGREQ